MAIAYDATSGAQSGWTTSDTFAHTCTGSNRLLLVWVYFDRGNGTYNVSSLTYAGMAMQQVATFAYGYRYAELWLLVEPSTGANNIVATYSNVGPTAKVIIRALSYTGVDQTNPIGSTVSATGSLSNASVVVTSATDELVSDFVSAEPGVTLTAGDGQTSRFEHEAGANGIAAIGFSDKAGAASVTMGWSWTLSDWWNIAAVSIKPVGAAPGGVPKTTRQTLMGVG